MVHIPVFRRKTLPSEKCNVKHSIKNVLETIKLEDRVEQAR